MAYTQADIDNLEKALANGALEVEYSGQRVKFRTLAEIRSLLAEMRASVSGTPRPRFSDVLYNREES